MLVLWLLLQGFQFSQAQSEQCIALPSSVRALKAGTEKIFEPIYAKEPLLMVGSTKRKKFIKIKIAESFYWIPYSDYETLTPNQCRINTCVSLSSSVPVYQRPQKKQITSLEQEGVFKILSTLKGWSRISANDKFFWVMNKDVIENKIACDATSGEVMVKDLSTHKSSPKGKSTWMFGFEFGYIFNVSKKPLSNLQTPIPPAGTDVNDDAFDSPFIDSISDGTGWFLGATLETPFFWNLLSKWALGYKTRNLEYVRRNNPHNGSVSFITHDQLIPETVSQEFSFIYATATIKLNGYQMLGLNWQPGIVLGFDYSLDDFEIEFRTAPLKLTQYYVRSGYQDIEFLYGPKLEINKGYFNIGLSAIFTDYGMEPALSLGMQF